MSDSKYYPPADLTPYLMSPELPDLTSCSRGFDTKVKLARKEVHGSQFRNQIGTKKNRMERE
jgi:hypothetical protein